MAQEEMYYRPPSEVESFIVRVMKGCPHNQCTFCNLFKQTPCKVLPLEEVLAGLDNDAKDYVGPEHVHLIKSIYLEGGDPLALPTDNLLAIMFHARRLFPRLTRFACYATAKFTIKKQQSALKKLAKAGLQRVFVGLESGCDSILQSTRKGCTASDLKLAGKMFKEAGIEMDVSMMLGIGGQELSRQHALETAALLNEIAPVCVRIRTFVAKEDTELGNDCLAGHFQLMQPHETLQELRLLVENIHTPMQLLSDHWSNFMQFSAEVPEVTENLLAYIDEHLAYPRSHFRTVGITAETS